ncbi:unnamed protein product [Musa hybrid cultivar]
MKKEAVAIPCPDLFLFSMHKRCCRLGDLGGSRALGMLNSMLITLVTGSVAARRRGGVCGEGAIAVEFVLLPFLQGLWDDCSEQIPKDSCFHLASLRQRPSLPLVLRDLRFHCRKMGERSRGLQRDQQRERSSRKKRWLESVKKCRWREDRSCRSLIYC